MVFNPVNRHCIVAEDFPLLSVGNKYTKYVSTFKYLGHVVGNKGEKGKGTV